MRRVLVLLTYGLLATCAFLAWAFVHLQAKSTHANTPYVDMTPWYLWLEAPYVALLLILVTFQDRLTLVKYILVGTVVIGTPTLGVAQAILNDTSGGPEWLAIPAAQLAGCLLLLMVVVLRNRSLGRAKRTERGMT